MHGLVALAAIVLSLSGCAPLNRHWVQTGFDETCRPRPEYAAAAQANTDGLDRLEWSPFGAPERGWRVYAPAIAREIGARCAPGSDAFAAHLARWQAAHGLPDTGLLEAQTFETMKADWQGRRPFVAVRAQGICPDPPDEAALAPAAAEDSYMGKTVLVEAGALRAFTRMRAAARRDLGFGGGDETLAVFSAYRSPQYDAARCERDQNCQGVVRAQCSAHRTGAALDLALGAAPGYAVDASDQPNRLFQSQTPAYRWLVANARRFGFVNYVFEPWHWEWTGRDPSIAGGN